MFAERQNLKSFLRTRRVDFSCEIRGLRLPPCCDKARTHLIGLGTETLPNQHGGSTHAPEPPLWSKDQDPDPVPVTGNAKRAMPHARR